MLIRLVASVLLIVASFAAVEPSALAQDSDDSTPSSIDATFTTETVDHDASNLSALLIGAVLLSAGVWAYINKKKRFPGARFRD